jgi:hypothetical protein
MIGVPFRATFTPDAPSDYPEVSFDVDERSGSLVVTRMTLTATAKRPIQPEDVPLYSLRVLMSRAARDGFVSIDTNGLDLTVDAPKSWESVIEVVRERLLVDRKRLKQVAKHYKVGGVDAVMDNLQLRRTHAYRLIRYARNDGLIHD